MDVGSPPAGSEPFCPRSGAWVPQGNRGRKRRPGTLARLRR